MFPPRPSELPSAGPQVSEETESETAIAEGVYRGYDIGRDAFRKEVVIWLNSLIEAMTVKLRGIPKWKITDHLKATVSLKTLQFVRDHVQTMVRRKNV